MFWLSDKPLQAVELQAALAHDQAGALVCFEGRVRDHNQGRAVRGLAYQAYRELAERQGQRIVDAAIHAHAVLAARCVHRVGELAIGDVAVWVGVSAAHRDAAFLACREIIDRIKQDVPIWKNEHYAEGDSGWIHPEAG